MKKLFSLFFALGVVCSTFGVAFAEEKSSRSSDEIRVEIEKVREEIQKETLKNETFSSMSRKLSMEERMQKETAMLPLQNKLADLEYELAVAEGRIIYKDDLFNVGNNATHTKTSQNRSNTLQAGDIIIFETDRQSSSFDDNSIQAGIFNAVTQGWGHAMLVLENGQGLHIWHDVNSQIQPVQTVLDSIRYKRAVVKRITLSTQEQNFLTSYVNAVLLDRPYPNSFAVFSGWHSKNDSSKLYCSQGPWLAYNFAKNIDIDNNGGSVVYPVDIYNSQYGQIFTLQ